MIARKHNCSIRLILGFVFLFLLLLSKASFASDDLSFATEIVKDENKETYSLTIFLNSVNPGNTIYIYSNKPWDGGKEIAKSSRINDGTYTFKKIAAGTYYVCIVNREGQSECSNIIVE